jgi:hypothetical protein
MQFTSKVVAVSLISLLLSGAVSAAAQHNHGTPAQQRACKPDAFNFCSKDFPDADKITACLKKHRKHLSHDCKLVFSGKLK